MDQFCADITPGDGKVHQVWSVELCCDASCSSALACLPRTQCCKLCMLKGALYAFTRNMNHSIVPECLNAKLILHAWLATLRQTNLNKLHLCTNKQITCAAHLAAAPQAKFPPSHCSYPATISSSTPKSQQDAKPFLCSANLPFDILLVKSYSRSLFCMHTLTHCALCCCSVCWSIRVS